MRLARTAVMIGAALAAITIVSGACSSTADDDRAERGQEEILTDTAAAMANVESATFTIEQTGAVVFIDDAGQLAFKAADGRFAGPASSEALVTIDALGFTTQVGAVVIDGEMWISDPLTGDWTEAPDNVTFDPAALFDDDGFPALLTEAAASESTELVDGDVEPADDTEDAETEEADGDDNSQNRHHLRTDVAAARVAALTGGLVAEGSEVDLWIDADTDRVVELRFEVDINEEVSSWRMTIGDYDADVMITPPELGSSG